MMEFKILFFLKNVSKKLYLVPMKTVALAIQYVIQSLTSPATYKPVTQLSKDTSTSPLQSSLPNLFVDSGVGCLPGN